MGPNQIDVNNLNLTSNNGNVELVNQQVNVAQNMNVKADDFIVRAGKSTFESENSSRSSGAGVSFNPLAPITPANFTPSVNYSQSNGNMEGTTYNNSHITVGGNTTINTTGDMILSGADLVTNTIDGNIGGQLVIESLQDTVTGSNSGFGANISLPTVAEKKNAETGKVTPAHRAPTVGGSVTDGSVDKAWTSDQSSLIAKNGGTINVGSTTTVTGAVVVSENVDKPLIINTTELITNNLEDSDESTNTTIGFSGISESTPVPKTQYTYDNTDKEQSTLATMSNVVVNTGSGQVDLASKGINTDISKAQEVTKDEETHIDIPIPTDLLNSDTWKEFSNQFQQLIATPGDIIEGVQAALSDGSGTTTIDGHKLTTTNLTPYEEIKNNIIGTNAGISCSQSEACKNYEKLIEKYELPDGTYMNGYINPITNEYVPGITDVAAGALRIILTEAGKGDYAIKFVAAGDTMGQAKINDDTKTMIVNLSKMDITDLEQVTNVGVHESQRFTYENKNTDNKSLNNSDPKDEMYTSTPSIIDPNRIISGDTAWYYSTDLSGYRDKRYKSLDELYETHKVKVNGKLQPNFDYFRKVYGATQENVDLWEQSKTKKERLEAFLINSAVDEIKSANKYIRALFFTYGAIDSMSDKYSMTGQKVLDYAWEKKKTIQSLADEIVFTNQDTIRYLAEDVAMYMYNNPGSYLVPRERNGDSWKTQFSVEFWNDPEKVYNQNKSLFDSYMKKSGLTIKDIKEMKYDVNKYFDLGKDPDYFFETGQLLFRKPSSGGNGITPAVGWRGYMNKTYERK